MQLTATASYYLGYTLLALAFVSAVSQAWKRRDRHRLDVNVLIFCLLLPELIRGSNSGVMQWVRAASVGLLPWALLRLVRHFRQISPKLSLGALAVGVMIPAFLAAFLPEPIVALRSVNNTYLAVSIGLLSAILAREARRSIGIKARRIVLAASGSALFAISFCIYAIFVWTRLRSSQLLPLTTTMQGVANICFFLAFATPRPLLSRWRRAEQTKYLTQAMGRDPEERGRLAGDDLFQAAVGGAGGAVTLVALRPSPLSAELVLSAANDAPLAGERLVLDAGLVSQVMSSGKGTMGLPERCDPGVAQFLGAEVANVLVAPVVADGPCWGVVVVGLRRGTLFPEDDLAMLAQMGRNAATTLDHARLLAERRAQERSVADRRLRALESRVEMMLASIKDYAMFVLDADGNVAAWQLGAQHLFGYASVAIIGHSAAVLYGLTPLEFTAWLGEARAWGHVEREASCTRLDGSTFIGTTTVRPLVEESGALPGFVAVTHDVTDRRQLEDRLRQGQKMEAIGQLAGGVAHDFNNLLTAILGYADWLDQDLSGDPRQAQVTEIQKAAERAADLTRQLLAFSRRQMLRPSAVNLSELIGALLPLLRRLIGEQIQIADATSPTLPAVMGDRSQVEQIVLNLVVNARDAMPDGGSLTIRTSDVWLHGLSGPGAMNQAPGPYVLLEVTDTGVGMDEATRQRVFEPFFTTKEVGRGTGLGLSTVYGIVQQMGGAIEVQSAPHRGATFRLWFPQASTSAVAPASAAKAAPPSERRGHETLLLVEDESAVRQYLARLLESNGYRVITADHPSRALALMESFDEPVDLVISDVVMPGSTGPELVRLLGQVRPGLSALFISGYADSMVARHANGMAGQELLLKPFSSNELLTKIRQILAAA